MVCIVLVSVWLVCVRFVFIIILVLFVLFVSSSFVFVCLMIVDVLFLVFVSFCFSKRSQQFKAVQIRLGEIVGCRDVV